MIHRGIYRSKAEASSEECDLTLHEHSVYIYFNDAEKSLLIWDLEATASMKWSGSELVIHKAEPNGASLVCSGEIARAIENAHANIPREKPKEGFNYVLLFLYGWPILGFILLCLLGYFIVLPWVAERSVSLVSVENEIAIGAQLEKTYAGDEVVNDSATHACNQFLNSLSLHTVYPLRVKVVQSSEINAFALPGGNMVVYTGILEKMDSYEELAALLSHEATHVIHRHSLKSVFRSAAAGLLISILFGDAGSVSAGVLSQADQFKQLDYSRKLETEADLNGLNLMVKNKINPQGMLELLKMLKKEETEMPHLMKYLSTHPETDERIQRVSEQAGIGLRFPVRKDLEDLFKRIVRDIKVKQPTTGR